MTYTLCLPQTIPVTFLPLVHPLLGIGVVEVEALLEAVGNGSLACGRALGEGSGATEGAGRSTVAETNDANVLGSTNLAVAGHALRHLDLDGVVGVGGNGQACDAQSGHVLGDLGVLEGLCVRATRRRVDGGRERTSTVLVDLRVRDVSAGCQAGPESG